MKVVGLITEYNPFHKGHLFHMNEAKKISNADFSVAIMSGNFVQRGDPSVVDKWTRTKIALENGVDVVIELPVYYSTSSAEFFALSSISLLESTGIVDSVCFGSELGDLEKLDKIASILANEPKKYKMLLNQYLDKGFNFPKARSLALENYMPEIPREIINTPNNILGIEYLKALKRINSKIIPYTILRMGANYHDKRSSLPIASATAIRDVLKESKNANESLEKLLPKASYLEFRKAIDRKITPIFPEDFFPLLQYKLLTTNPKELVNILDITEGFENRIHSTIHQGESMEEFLELLETKRYTRTRINRALFHILLDIKKKPFHIFNNNGYAQYIKILGFRKEAQVLMKEMKNKSSIPIITNVKKSEKNLTSLQKSMLEADIKSTNIYNTVVLSKYNKKAKNDYTQSTIII